MAKVVRLIRVSTQKQKDAETPETQRAALDALLKVRGGTLVEEIEAAVSGGADVRPDIERLQALAEQRTFSELHVYKKDRISRHDDPMMRMRVYSMGAKYGFIIIEADGTVTDPSKPTDEIGYYMTQWASALERRKIRDRAQDGADRLKAAGRRTGSIPRGFAVTKDGKWSTTPEIELVKAAIKAYADGASGLAVCRMLGLTPRGATVLLKHPIYRGITKHGVRVFSSEEQPVPDDLWLRVQTRVQAQKISRTKVRERAQSSWASSLIWSAHEQDNYDMSKPYAHKLYGQTASGRPDRYRCPCSDPEKGLTRCGIGFPRTEHVHTRIDAVLVKLTNDSATLAMVKQTTTKPTPTVEREALENQIKRLDARHERLKDAYYEGLETREGFDRRMAAYKAERAVAQERFDAISPTAASAKEQIDEWLAGFVWDANWSPQVKRDWLRRYTRRVAITQDGVRLVVLRIPGGVDGLAVFTGWSDVEAASGS